MATKHAFAFDEGNHARRVVMSLIKARRYFLHHHDPRSGDKDPGYNLDPNIFGEAIELDTKIRSIYPTIRSVAERQISLAERELGVTPPDLSGNKQIVQCKCYSGGLEICRVFPLSAFLRLAPKSLATMNVQSHRVAKKILSESEALRQYDYRNDRCVVMMQTRFRCDDSDERGDFMQGRTRDLQRFPYALGYLFYRYSQRTRIVRHDHVVFNTSRESHVNVQHWSGEKPTINYNANGGYDCPVMFVTVL